MGLMACTVKAMAAWERIQAQRSHRLGGDRRPQQLRRRHQNQIKERWKQEARGQAKTILVSAPVPTRESIGDQRTIMQIIANQGYGSWDLTTEQTF